MNKCIDGCYHHQCSQRIIEKAQSIGDKINAQHQYDPTVIDLTAGKQYNNGMIGVIGQLGVFEAVEEMGIALDQISDPFDPTIHKDKFDYMHRGAIHDIKTLDMGFFNQGDHIGERRKFVHPNSISFVNLEKREKDMDYYTFVKIDTEDWLLHIVGIVSYTDFWDKLGKPFESPNSKHPCYYIRACDMTDWQPYIFGLPSKPRKKVFDYKKEGWKREWR